MVTATLKIAMDYQKVVIIAILVDATVTINVVVLGVQRNPMVTVHGRKLDVLERRGMDTAVEAKINVRIVVVYGVTMPLMILQKAAHQALLQQ